MVLLGCIITGQDDSAVLRRLVRGEGIEIDRSATIKAAKALTIPSVTVRNSFRIVKA